MSSSLHQATTYDRNYQGYKQCGIMKSICWLIDGRMLRHNSACDIQDTLPERAQRLLGCLFTWPELAKATILEIEKKAAGGIQHVSTSMLDRMQTWFVNDTERHTNRQTYIQTKRNTERDSETENSERARGCNGVGEGVSERGEIYRVPG